MIKYYLIITYTYILRNRQVLDIKDIINNKMLLIDTILDLIYPRHCIGCNAPQTDFCQKCISLCGGPERETSSWIFPLFDYRDKNIKKTIWFIKYKGKKRLVRIMSEILYHRILEELSELVLMKNFTKPILIPIPLSRKRHRERGFNQTKLICKELIKVDNNKYLKLEQNILFKIKETPHQAYIKNRQERLRNLKDSFIIKNRNLIKNRNIILIDDVITTGATLSEARKMLKQSGAKKIIAFTLAH